MKIFGISSYLLFWKSLQSNTHNTTVAFLTVKPKDSFHILMLFLVIHQYSNFKILSEVMKILQRLEEQSIPVAHSAVLPYLLSLPLFMKFRGREGWPKIFRGGWKSAFLINFNESFRYKSIRKRFEVD